MYFLFALSSILAMWAWWLAWPGFFFIFLGVSIFLLAYIDLESLYLESKFYSTSIKTMTKTRCCLMHDLWSQPSSVRWTCILFRGLSATLAINACAISSLERNRFLKKKYFSVTICWASVACTWLLSCFPMFICLIQCAASTKYRTTNTQIPPREIILRFRKVYSLWLLHDVVLGIFWLYLAIMLYDLCDDEDDSEWRTIFLSMLSWHILVISFHELYVKKYYSLKNTQHTDSKSTPCCGPSNAKIIWSFLTIGSFVGIYVLIIQRMQDGSLLQMGTKDISTPIFFSLCFVVFVVSKHFENIWTTNTTKQYKNTPHTKQEKAKLMTTLPASTLDF